MKELRLTLFGLGAFSVLKLNPFLFTRVFRHRSQFLTFVCLNFRWHLATFLEFSLAMEKHSASASKAQSNTKKYFLYIFEWSLASTLEATESQDLYYTYLRCKISINKRNVKVWLCKQRYGRLVGFFFFHEVFRVYIAQLSYQLCYNTMRQIIVRDSTLITDNFLPLEPLYFYSSYHNYATN